MAYTFEELKKKKVDQLREIAKDLEHEAVKGYTQMNKEHLLAAICKALNIDMHEHHEVVGLNKTTIKAKIKDLKKRRDEALAARNLAEHKNILRTIHVLKRKIHKATV
jgi:DNA-binding IclR family transcriptional regulator